jgi:DNA-directed RNA polymerase specialized sigma24 family protein
MEPSSNQLIALWIHELKESSFALAEAARPIACNKKKEWEHSAAAAAKRADSALEQLFSEHFVPVVRARVAARFSAAIPDYKDICQEAFARLTNKLQQLRAQEDVNGTATMIRTADWRAYAAKVASSCMFEHIRKQSKLWRSVSGKLYYLFTKREGLAVWQADGQDVCGRSEWRGQNAPDRRHDNPRLAAIMAGGVSGPWPRLVDAILAESGGPILFRDLVALFHRYSLPRMEEQRSEMRDDDIRTLEDSPDRAESPEGLAYLKTITERLWKSIVGMPVGYRRALLLNLKGTDGGDIQLMDYLKLASRADIGACVEIEAEDFNELWPKLPVDDHAIAAMFGVARQQVINWRSAARERLRRDLNDWE